MKEVLPIIIVCGVGLSVCVGLLVFFFVRYVRSKIRKKSEEFEMDENTLTIRLDKKDLRK